MIFAAKIGQGKIYPYSGSMKKIKSAGLVNENLSNRRVFFVKNGRHSEKYFQKISLWFFLILLMNAFASKSLTNPFDCNHLMMSTSR